MPDHEHEPWMYKSFDGKMHERVVSGLLAPPAYVCRLCGTVYVAKEVRELWDRGSADLRAAGIVGARADKKRKTDA